MLGVRGVRLAVLKPALYRMQVRALVAGHRRRAGAGAARPGPRSSSRWWSWPAELALARSWVDQELAAAGAAGADGARSDLAVGAMIETPRAALVAGQLARRRTSCPSAPTT